MSDTPSKDAVPPDDDTATTPLGVGEHMNKGGEELADKDPNDADGPDESGDGAGPASGDKTGINP